MPSFGPESRAWSLLTLQRTRWLPFGLRYRVLVGLVALGYGCGAMIFGRMLYIPSHPLSTAWSFYIYPSGPGPSWAYPLILIGSPYFQFGLPFISGILVTLSAAGVGLGMSVAVFLSAQLIRRRKAGLLRPTVAGAAAGLTPAMIALLTIGACCSTTAAATAGISLAAQSSGTTPAAALANGWYLGVFQVAVIYVALLAQEQLLSVYGWLFGDVRSGSSRADTDKAGTSPLGWRGAASGALRIALVAAGLTWSLSVLADWSATPLGRANAAVWIGCIVQHEVPGVFAVMVALFPAGVLSIWSGPAPGRSRWILRATLVGCGLALLTWLPPSLSGAGAAALGNELLGGWGLPASWGAIAPPALGPIGLSLRWTFQFALLGLVSVATGISPGPTLRWFAPSSVAEQTTDLRGIVSRESASPRPERV